MTAKVHLKWFHTCAVATHPTAEVPHHEAYGCNGAHWHIFCVDGQVRPQPAEFLINHLSHLVSSPPKSCRSPEKIKPSGGYEEHFSSLPGLLLSSYPEVGFFGAAWQLAWVQRSRGVWDAIIISEENLKIMSWCFSSLLDSWNSAVKT